MKASVTVQGYPICAEITPLDEGIHVLLTGGIKTHIGSMSVAEPDGPEQAITLPHHREDVVARQWASALSARFQCRVAVVCGIHYDMPGKEGLRQIVDCTERLLQEIQHRLVAAQSD